MSALVSFDFDGELVRVVTVDGEPHLVGRDVCGRLGYVDPTNAMKQHCKGVVKRHPLVTAGGMQKVRVLSEPDVWRLIVASKLPAAQRFERWLFETVLPEIRRTGRFGEAGAETASELDRVLILARSCELVRRTHGRAAAQRLWTAMGGLPLCEFDPPIASRPASFAEAHFTIKERADAALRRRVRLFLDDRCLVEKDGLVQATALYSAYRRWALDGGMAVMSQSKFGRFMTFTEFRRDASVGLVMYCGLRLKRGALMQIEG